MANNVLDYIHKYETEHHILGLSENWQCPFARIYFKEIMLTGAWSTSARYTLMDPRKISILSLALREGHFTLQ